MDTITFGFDMPVFAFGTDIITFATTNGAYRATTDGGEFAFSFFDPFPGFNAGQFIGFKTDTPFTSVTISQGPFAEDQSYTLDTMRYVQVPQPAPMLLLGTGLVRLVGLKRKFRK